MDVRRRRRPRRTAPDPHRALCRRDVSVGTADRLYPGDRRSQPRPEQNTQGDFSLSAHYENFRAKIGGFQAFINDYITFEQVATVTGFDQAHLLQYVNTGLATLSGGEASAEYDPSPWFTVFGAVAYVDGRDQTLDAPLLAISPLDSWVGVRWHDSEPQRRWDLEFAVRIVAAQDRLGTIRVLGGAPTVVEEETPAFAVCNLRGYYHYSKTLKFTAGVDNLFNENYLEHLDMRVNGPPGFPAPETRSWLPASPPRGPGVDLLDRQNHCVQGWDSAA